MKEQIKRYKSEVEAFVMGGYMAHNVIMFFDVDSGLGVDDL